MFIYASQLFHVLGRYTDEPSPASYRGRLVRALAVKPKKKRACSLPRGPGRNSVGSVGHTPTFAAGFNLSTRMTTECRVLLGYSSDRLQKHDIPPGLLHTVPHSRLFEEAKVTLRTLSGRFVPLSDRTSRRTEHDIRHALLQCM